MGGGGPQPDAAAALHRARGRALDSAPFRALPAAREPVLRGARQRLGRRLRRLPADRARGDGARCGGARGGLPGHRAAHRGRGPAGRCHTLLLRGTRRGPGAAADGPQHPHALRGLHSAAARVPRAGRVHGQGPHGGAHPPTRRSRGHALHRHGVLVRPRSRRLSDLDDARRPTPAGRLPLRAPAAGAALRGDVRSGAGAHPPHRHARRRELRLPHPRPGGRHARHRTHRPALVARTAPAAAAHERLRDRRVPEPAHARGDARARTHQPGAARNVRGPRPQPARRPDDLPLHLPLAPTVQAAQGGAPRARRRAAPDARDVARDRTRHDQPSRSSRPGQVRRARGGPGIADR